VLKKVSNPASDRERWSLVKCDCDWRKGAEGLQCRVIIVTSERYESVIKKLQLSIKLHKSLTRAQKGYYESVPPLSGMTRLRSEVHTKVSVIVVKSE
jgi:hypothetical protein